MGEWKPDVLGDGYEQQTIDLGEDPDGEGEIVATLVRRTWTGRRKPQRAVLYVHGFSDYFFQRELADFHAERGFAFYALDLRKCGRSRRDGHTPHFVSDLELYDTELNAALAVVRADTGDSPVLLEGHSTGGLVLPLWVDRLRRAGERTPADTGVSGLVLNSPWFDLQAGMWMRTLGTQALGAAARLTPKRVLELPSTDAYGVSLSATERGMWDYDLDWKPLHGFAVTVGWLAAVRAGHAQLHRGLDVGVPSLVLRSDKSHRARSWREPVDVSDAVLEVADIARWAGCLGGPLWSIPVTDARHDVFLSLDQPRKQAYETLDAWLRAFDLI
ncbi:alpha/beta hydrolase [Aeromicrobium sp. CTD01-1L150]|uniref:alpha/beta hydrolase n=1 Tax=Aeromicrobium sp. CTD01-1L150 TaxID=3341830 RepID=UPI0035C001AB